MKKPKPRTQLWWIGVWATVWWGVSLLWLVAWVWLAKEPYILQPEWGYALESAFEQSSNLQLLLALILLGWLLGGLVWLKELKRNRISYKAGFKDLFLTIRR